MEQKQPSHHEHRQRQKFLVASQAWREQRLHPVGLRSRVPLYSFACDLPNFPTCRHARGKVLRLRKDLEGLQVGIWDFQLVLLDSLNYKCFPIGILPKTVHCLFLVFLSINHWTPAFPTACPNIQIRFLPPRERLEALSSVLDKFEIFAIVEMIFRNWFADWLQSNCWLLQSTCFSGVWQN